MRYHDYFLGQFSNHTLNLFSPEWVAILVSILIGLAGLFEVKTWFFKPKLKISINLIPPDCHRIGLKNPTNGNLVASVFYLRLRINNEGNREGKNVQVMLAELETFEGGTFKIQESFLPLNLKWSHFGIDTMQSIPSGVFRHCDLGFLTGGHYKEALLKSFSLSRDSKVVLKTDTIVEPNTGSHIIFPGIHRLTIYVSVSNGITIKKKFEINLKNEWDESKLEKLINIDDFDFS